MKLIIIGLCIGFIIGNIVGVVLMSIMAASSRDSRERELNECTQESTDIVDDYGKAIFQKKCPYTGNNCEAWNCADCEVEKAERELFND